MNLLRIILLIGLLFFQSINLNASAYYSGSKPMFVIISTDWCFACKIVKPTIEEIEREYGDQVEFIALNASNEETIKQAEYVASDYGITDLFNKHKNAFPTIVISYPRENYENVLLGAKDKQTYEQVLNNLLSGNSNIAKSEPKRPDEPKITDISGGRPDEPQITNNRPPVPNFLDRPAEPDLSGRPPLLTFWTLGQQIPYYAYYRSLVLPKCDGNINIICANGTNNNISNGKTNISNAPNEPVFKPWDPNYTRDEKGLHF